MFHKPSFLSLSGPAIVISALIMNALGETAAEPSKTDSAKPAAATTEKKAGKVKPQLKPQTTCPVMGGDIDKNIYVDYKGKRIYACCQGCVPEITKDPEKYIKKLADMGQDVETIAPAKKNKTAEKKHAEKADSSVKNMDSKDKKMNTDTSGMKGMDHGHIKM